MNGSLPMTSAHGPQVENPSRRFSEAGDPDLRKAYRLLHAPIDAAGMERRKFLQGMLAVGGVTALGLPMLSSKAAQAGPPLGSNEHILITLVLAGGNDGLNTVCPLDDGRYYDLRGSLAVDPAGTHPVGENLYLHPNLSRLASRFNSGQVAIIRGVGEPSDDHSHFEGLARWMAGTSQPKPWYDGWLGRYLDGLNGDPLSGVAIGDSGVPLHLQRPVGEATAIPGWGGLWGLDYNANNYNRPLYDALLDFNASGIGHGDFAEEIAATHGRAISTARTVGGIFTPQIDINDSLVRDAELVARLINLDVGARVISMSMRGYDTHASQRPEHDNFLNSVDRAIDRIFDNINPALRGRVVLMTMSEFGRRPAHNGSGTDHGTANAHFVVGEAVTGGLYGEQPSLRNLDQRDDLRHSVDFRSMYATMIDSWLDGDSTEILGASYEELPLFNHACEGVEATIVGTSASEAIHGTDGRDIIVAGAGSDVIYGHGGDDLICAGTGNDTVFGGEGADNILGEGGSDDLRGGPGNDYLRGGDGHDQLHGERGMDTLRGNAGADQLFGKRTEDTFITGLPDTILRGQ